MNSSSGSGGGWCSLPASLSDRPTCTGTSIAAVVSPSPSKKIVQACPQRRWDCGPMFMLRDAVAKHAVLQKTEMGTPDGHPCWGRTAPGSQPAACVTTTNRRRGLTSMAPASATCCPGLAQRASSLCGLQSGGLHRHMLDAFHQVKGFSLRWLVTVYAKRSCDRACQSARCSTAGAHPVEASASRTSAVSDVLGEAAILSPRSCGRAGPRTRRPPAAAACRWPAVETHAWRCTAL